MWNVAFSFSFLIQNHLSHVFSYLHFSSRKYRMSRTCRKGGGILESNSHGTLLYRYTESSNVTGTPGASTSSAGDAASDFDSEDEDNGGIGMETEEEQGTAALAAAAVAAAVAAGDASAYLEAVQAQRKEESSSFSV